MSLFSAMTSGVSGLLAQSSAMSAIADNITNVNTIGYKNTEVEFQTLVTKQTSSTLYSAGGVQSRPRGSNDVQGLLQATTGPTDLAISGPGFFVVNEARRPGTTDQFLFTRAGSFIQDNEGFLRNTAGFYLQGWPTDPQGNVILPQGSSAALANQSIISSDFLETVNLNRIRGTASPTDMISVGANLPANAAVGDSHNIELQFLDSLGNTNDTRLTFSKSAANEWDLTVEPPNGTSMVTLYDAAGDVYKSAGQLEFSAIPADGETVQITTTSAGTQTFTFRNGASAANEVEIGSGRTLPQIVLELRDDVNTALGGTLAALKSGNPNVLVLTGDTEDIIVDPTGVASALVQTSVFTVQDRDNTNPAVVFSANGAPAQFNVDRMSAHDFASGAADMDDLDIDGDGDIDVERITVDFGNIGESDGLTQFGGEFTPTFVEQNGARFGTFSGVTIAPDGQMVALFDNGERRPIFKIPVATVVNPHGLDGKTGNVWNATAASGDPTLLVADSGNAGQVIQASLESSTVDIGEEFTKMIIVQRAYSAATRIISTADEMLEELVRVKR